MNCSAAMKVGHPYPRNFSLSPFMCSGRDGRGQGDSSVLGFAKPDDFGNRAGQMLRTQNGLDYLK